MSGVAGVAGTLSHRGVRVLLAESLYQILVAGITEVGIQTGEFGQLADFHAANIYLSHPSGNQFRFFAAMRIVTAGAVTFGGDSMNEGLVEIQFFVIMTGRTQIVVADVSKWRLSL